MQVAQQDLQETGDCSSLMQLMQLMLLLTSVCPTFRVDLDGLGQVQYGLASYGRYVLGLCDQESSQHAEVDAADLIEC